MIVLPDYYFSQLLSVSLDHSPNLTL